jgi:hypothetical protein
VKKLLNVIVLMLALNFLAVAGVVGWLKTTGKLDREKVYAIKDILFPKEQSPTTQPSTTQPSESEEGSAQPMARLEALLAHQTGTRTASEQVEFIQRTFDAQMAQLDRRQREVNDLSRQVELAKQQIARDRGELETQRKTLDAREQEASKLATDKGFQDSLALYKSMSGKQVKTIFMTLDQNLVASYLQAMEPRAATKIIKEFKSPEETSFIQKVMERVRQATPQAMGEQPQAMTAGQ